MATNNMNNLTTLIRRLEAATLRLEDIASSTIELPQAVPALQAVTSTTNGNSTSATPSPAPPAPAAARAPPEPVPECIEEFDSFIQTSVGKYVKASNKIGGLVAEQAAKVLAGFQAERQFLLITTKAKKPDLSGAEMSILQDLLKGINEAVMAVSTLKESNRGAPVFTHLSAVGEGIMVLAWVTIDSMKPWKHVEETFGSTQFFGNRILKEHKDKGLEHVEWVKALNGIFQDLTEYIKQQFPSGIPWNPNGPPAKDVMRDVAAAAAASPPPPPPPAAGGAPPPPPPPGPPPVLQIKETNEKPAVAAGGTGLGAVFSELNKGESVTKGLRKVDKSEMTHKNPSLRAGSTVTEGNSNGARGKSPAPGKKPKPEAMRVKKPPKKELDGNKWLLENYDSPSEPIEIDASISHSILISNCKKTTIIVRGKANAVTIENTSRLSLIVDSLVSSVDIVKSANFALQVVGSIPTVMMDQIDGAQIYLSKDSTSATIYSSKSAGINMLVLAGEEGDYKEIPLPSQICSRWDEKKGDVVSEIVFHSG